MECAIQPLLIRLLSQRAVNSVQVALSLQNLCTSVGCSFTCRRSSRLVLTLQYTFISGKLSIQPKCPSYRRIPPTRPLAGCHSDSSGDVLLRVGSPLEFSGYSFSGRPHFAGILPLIALPLLISGIEHNGGKSPAYAVSGKVSLITRHSHLWRSASRRKSLLSRRTSSKIAIC